MGPVGWALTARPKATATNRYAADVAVADTSPPDLGERRLARVLIGVLTVYWAVITGALLLFVPSVEAFVRGRVGDVIVPEPLAVPLLLNLVALPLAGPIATWTWIRTARAALGPDGTRQRRWIPAVAVVLLAVHAVCWVPFVTAFKQLIQD